MKRLRIIHQVRTILALVAFIGTLSVAALITYANYTGLPDSWRDQIVKSLSRDGIHAEIGSLRYFPFRGIEARDINLYREPEHQRLLAQANSLFIKVDRTKLARGEVRIEHLELHGGQLRLPVDPDNPHSATLQISSANGRALMPGGGRLEIRDVQGLVGGIQIKLHAQLSGYNQSILQRHDPEGEEAAKKARRELLQRIVTAIDSFEFHSQSPPTISLYLEGDVRRSGSYRASIHIQAHDLTCHNVAITELDAQGELRDRVLVLESIQARDQRGSLDGRLEFDLDLRRGRFDGTSTVDLPLLLHQLKADSYLGHLTLPSPPTINAHATFELPQNRPPIFLVLGHFHCDQLRYNRHTLESADADFSWDGEKIFLENVKLRHREGFLQARILAAPDLVRYRIHTNLRAHIWESFYEGKVLGKVLQDFDDLPGAAADVRLAGSFVPGAPHSWTCGGTASARNISFRKVPVHSASVRLDLNHDQLDFADGQVDFNYSSYRLRKAHQGPSSGKGSVGLIRWDRETSCLIIRDVQGTFWPAPVVRTFSTSIADHLESYGLHQPIPLRANGTVGLFDAAPRTNLKIQALTPGTMDYRLAGHDLTIEKFTADITVRHHQTEVRNLNGQLFEGPLRGELTIQHSSENRKIHGELIWDRLHLPAIAKSFEFNPNTKGFLTGRIEFTQTGNDISSLSGEGLCALEEGELFSVPLFGPLSPLLATILTTRKASFQDAKDAFCTFHIQNGIFRTRDFLTTTPSLTFNGKATANLVDMSLDMTLRMDARGLLGIITLPLKPFYGLFQFRGTGPIHHPTWKNVLFTPSDEEPNVENHQEGPKNQEDEEKPTFTTPKARPFSHPGRR